MVHKLDANTLLPAVAAKMGGKVKQPRRSSRQQRRRRCFASRPGHPSIKVHRAGWSLLCRERLLLHTIETLSLARCDEARMGLHQETQETQAEMQNDGEFW